MGNGSTMVRFVLFIRPIQPLRGRAGCGGAVVAIEVPDGVADPAVGSKRRCIGH